MKHKIIFAFALLSVLALTVINVSAQESTNIQVNFISQTPDPVEPGDYVELRFKVDNKGAKSSEYIFELGADYPFSFDEGETPQKSVGSLTGYQSVVDGAIIYWKLRVAEDAVEGSMNTVRIKYWRKGNPDFVIQGPEQSIRIQSKQGLVEIENVEMDPKEVEIGTMFDMNISISNKGSSFVKNVKVTIDTTGTGFTPVGMANQKTLNRIPERSSRNVNFRFFVNTDTNIEVNELPIKISYYDKFGNEYSVSTYVGVSVIATPSYLTNLESTDIFMSGKKGKVVVSISNIGKGMLNFVVLELLESPDYEIIGPSKSYLGNLESDDFETGQFQIYVYPTDKEFIPLKFRMHYRDNYDRVYNDTFEIENRIYSREKATELGIIPTVDYSSSVILVLIIIAIVGFWWYKRRYKKKHKKK